MTCYDKAAFDWWLSCGTGAGCGRFTGAFCVCPKSLFSFVAVRRKPHIAYEFSTFFSGVVTTVTAAAPFGASLAATRLISSASFSLPRCT